MSEAKPFASLGATLLARKGGAKPAMGPQNSAVAAVATSKVAAQNLEVGQRSGQRDGFLKRRPGGSAVTVGFQVGVQHPGARPDPVMFHQEASSPSYRLIGWAGMMVEIACLYTSCD